MGRYSREERAPSVSVSAEGMTLGQSGLVLRFDAAGRVTTLYDGNHIFHRGIDNSILEKWWSNAQTNGTHVRMRQSRRVSTSRRNELLDTAYGTASRCLPPVLDERESDLRPTERESIRRVLQQSPDALKAERRAVRSIYEPVGVLPPDQYKAVVLQSVMGCPYDCSFCTLYRDTDVTVRSVDEFEDHTAAVNSFFGRGVNSHRTVFLGDADPLAAPQDDLIRMLNVIARTFPSQHATGVGAFLTARTAAHTPQCKLDMLAKHGIERVYIGIESGSEDILTLLRKPQTPDEVVTGIERVKAAGIGVGVIVLAGVGGYELADVHLARTRTLIRDIPLDARDIVYVSPLAEAETADYRERLQERSLSRMDDVEIAAQAKRLRSLLDHTTTARVSRYHVSEFVYS